MGWWCAEPQPDQDCLDVRIPRHPPKLQDLEHGLVGVGSEDFLVPSPDAATLNRSPFPALLPLIWLF